MKDISFEKALSKTIIEVEESFIENVFNKIAEEVVKQEYIPPLFDEFTIKYKSKNVYSNSEINKMILDVAPDYWSLSESDREKILDEIQTCIPSDDYIYLCVRYISATEYNIIVFDNNHKKKIIINCKWVISDDENDEKIIPDLKVIATFGMEYDTNTAQYFFVLVNAIMYYMQHYNPEIEYKEIKVEQKKTKEKQNNNKGYEQKITLKSKKTKYILSTENHKENIKKLKNYKTPCWNVRGYYQRFGKDKVLKYIPPRINYRKKLNDKESQGNAELLEAKPKTYVIK